MPPGPGLALYLQHGAGGDLTLTAVLLRAVGDPTGDAGAGDRGQWLAGGAAVSRPTPPDRHRPVVAALWHNIPGLIEDTIHGTGTRRLSHTLIVLQGHGAVLLFGGARTEHPPLPHTITPTHQEQCPRGTVAAGVAAPISWGGRAQLCARGCTLGACLPLLAGRADPWLLAWRGNTTEHPQLGHHAWWHRYAAVCPPWDSWGDPSVGHFGVGGHGSEPPPCARGTGTAWGWHGGAHRDENHGGWGQRLLEQGLLKGTDGEGWMDRGAEGRIDRKTDGGGLTRAGCGVAGAELEAVQGGTIPCAVPVATPAGHRALRPRTPWCHGCRAHGDFVCCLALQPPQEPPRIPNSGAPPCHGQLSRGCPPQGHPVQGHPLHGHPPQETVSCRRSPRTAHGTHPMAPVLRTPTPRHAPHDTLPRGAHPMTPTQWHSLQGCPPNSTLPKDTHPMGPSPGSLEWEPLTTAGLQAAELHLHAGSLARWTPSGQGGHNGYPIPPPHPHITAVAAGAPGRPVAPGAGHW